MVVFFLGIVHSLVLPASRSPGQLVILRVMGVEVFGDPSMGQTMGDQGVPVMATRKSRPLN
jgi:hypothetical protein